MADETSDAEKDAIIAEIEHLRLEHGDLQAAMTPCSPWATSINCRFQRLKKRKLALRDRLQRLEDDLTPDIIA